MADPQFPLPIEEKEDHPDKLQLLKTVASKYFYKFSEFKIIIDALNWLGVNWEAVKQSNEEIKKGVATYSATTLAAATAYYQNVATDPKPLDGSIIRLNKVLDPTNATHYWSYQSDTGTYPDNVRQEEPINELTDDINDANQDKGAKVSIVNEVNNKIQGTHYEYRATTKIDSTTGFEGRILANDAENKSYVIPCLPNTTYYFENIVIDLLMQFTTDNPLLGNFIDGTKVSLVTDTVTTDATANFMALNVKVSENPEGFDNFRVRSSNTTAKNKDIENVNDRVDVNRVADLFSVGEDRFINVDYDNNEVTIPKSIVTVGSNKISYAANTLAIASGSTNSYLVFDISDNSIKEFSIVQFNAKNNDILFLGFLNKEYPNSTYVRTRYLKVNNVDVSVLDVNYDTLLNGFKPSYNTVIRYNSDTGFEGSTLPPDADKKSYKIICKPNTTYYLNNVVADILMQFSDESPANANFINGTKVSQLTGTYKITTSAIAKSFIVNIKLSQNPDGVEDFTITSSDTKASIRDVEQLNVKNGAVSFKKYDYPSFVEAADGTGEFDAENITVAEIYAVFDAMTELTSAVIGRDESDTFDIKSYTYNIPSLKPKIFIQSGIHGNGSFGDNAEHTIALYYFVKDLLTNVDDENLINLRNNFIFVFVPIANPWGFQNKSRGNSNNVDLNRNQDWNWQSGDIYGYSRGTSALSESESVALKNLYDKHTNSFLFIDMHVRGGSDVIANPFFEIRQQPAYNENLSNVVLGFLTKKYNGVSSHQDNTDESYLTGNQGGMAAEYWKYANNVNAVILEGFARSATESLHSLGCVQKNVAFFGTYILNMCLNSKANY